jgi:hypothetical protein
MAKLNKIFELSTKNCRLNPGNIKFNKAFQGLKSNPACDGILHKKNNEMELC